ncbi:MAG: dockerin type I domain-containing protein, partial [Planctomycetota bacterium]
FSESELEQLVSDANGDRAIAYIIEQPAHGSVSLGNDGLTYQPESDFNGQDSFRIAFTDGQDTSESVEFVITVDNVPDDPSGLVFLGGDLPENVDGPYAIGGIEVQDADAGDDYEFLVSDSRFEVRDGMLFLMDGGLNFEYESEVPLTVDAYDAAAGAFVTQSFMIRVLDRNDPVSQIFAIGYGLTENTPGGVVADLGYEDEDENDVVTLSVDDDRFEVIGEELFLREDATIDYESESVVVMTVTAMDAAGTSQSTELELSVTDIAEPVGDISLSNETVVEFEYGAPVGTVLLGGIPAADSYSVSVDDPRFEIIDSELKLREDEYVQQEMESEIELNLSARDVHGAYEEITQRFLIRVVANQSPYHNDDNPYDVNQDGAVSPQDALIIINYLNHYGLGPVGYGLPNFGYDVNGDGQVTALDALLVINYINSLQGGTGIVGSEDPSVEKETVNGGSGEGEGEDTGESSGEGGGLTIDGDAEGEFVGGTSNSSYRFGSINDSPLDDDEDDRPPSLF